MQQKWVRQVTLLLFLVAGLLLVRCGDDDDGGGGNGGGGNLKLGDQTFNDHGTADARGKATFALQADNFFFSPTFLRGEPGQKLLVEVTNPSSAKHNLTLAGGTGTDIDANAKATVEVTFPQSGVLLFFCKYHAGSGMNGELLAGDARPAAVSGAPSPGAASPSAGAGGPDYGY